MIQLHLIAFGFALLAGLVHVWLLWRLRPQLLIGDENDYVGPIVRTQALWVRVPLHRALMRTADRMVVPFGQRGATHSGARMLTGMFAVVSVALAVGHVESATGTGAACVTGLVLLASLERALLALHLWPDTAMGLVLVSFALLTGDPTPWHLALAAGVAVLGFAIRIEGAVLVLLAAALPLFLSDSGKALPGLVGLAGLGLLSLHARLRHGTWWPDTTARFNLAVARTELTLPGATTSEVMRVTARHVAAGSVPPMSRPWKAVAMLASRIKVLFGPDTYLAHNLLSRNRAGYHAADALCPPAPGAIILRHGFSVLALIFFAAIPWMPAGPLMLWVCMVVVYTGLQTRGRYRMVLLPLMALLLGLATEGVATRGITSTEALWAGLLAGAVGLVLWWVPGRDEMSPQQTGKRQA